VLDVGSQMDEEDLSMISTMCLMLDLTIVIVQISCLHIMFGVFNNLLMYEQSLTIGFWFIYCLGN
jgi:hypothetical protein